MLSLSALDSLWEEAVSSLLDSLADSALDSLLDSDALDAELEECSELLEALSAVLWEELDEDAGFSSVSVDTHIGERVWDEAEKVNYVSTPLFLLRAVK